MPDGCVRCANEPRMETDAEVADLRERLRRARSVSVLTGSGISAESGLPTFRGPGGLWRSHRVEELASPAGFARDPDLVWTWYNERRLAHRAVEPSPAHVALARLEERCADFTLITQNVDSLHLRAGSRNVLELHGKLREAKCTRCDARRPFDDAFDLAALDHDGCGGTWRPDIVWFGEPLPREVLEEAQHERSRRGGQAGRHRAHPARRPLAARARLGRAAAARLMRDAIALGVQAFAALLAGAVLVSIAAERLRIPAAVALVAVGTIVGSVLRVRPPFDFGPTLLFVFLPPLIFEAAWNIDLQALRRCVGRVALLAFPGTIATAALIALVLARAGALPFGAALLFGAMV